MKILIRATNWVGDAIMALPALRAMRGRYPDAQITVVARPYVAQIYRCQGVFDRMVPDVAKGTGSSGPMRPIPVAGASVTASPFAGVVGSEMAALRDPGSRRLGALEDTGTAQQRGGRKLYARIQFSNFPKS